MIHAVLGLMTVLGLAVTALAQGVDTPIERYRQAVNAGQTGGVRGRAFEERRKPSSPDLPLAGTHVALLPRSDAWLTRLEAVKRGARESANAFRDAASSMRKSREAYEKSLWQAGAGDLPLSATVDADGVFSLDGVPAGRWVLFASRSTYVDRTTQVRPPLPGSPPRSPPPPSPFLPADKLAGYHVVTYWLREITVAPGAPEAVELTDRNVWFTGVIESRQAPRLPDTPYVPPR